jgi:uncharacterized protein (DUF2062 family)
METEQRSRIEKNSTRLSLKKRIRLGIEKLKDLHGDPHYVAMGMAIGIWVSMTPTIPFHTVIAVGLSFLFRGSQIAAAIGVWFSNPLTIPIFYLASYKTGSLLFGRLSACNGACESISELLKLGMKVTLATLSGGAVIGIIPAIAVYFLTRTLVTRIKSSKTSFQ